MREFFVNEMNYYCPPLREMTKGFIKQVLRDEKFLLELKQLKKVTGAPLRLSSFI
jgi:hypothetical protein